jgi:parvulin-like peptidyl-prolyl isomerase
MLRSALVFAFATAAFAADVRVVEEIIVKVNGDIITKGDLVDRQRMIGQQLQQQEHLSGAALQQAIDAQSKDMLSSMIDERLLVQKAKEMDLKVEGEVNRRMSELQVASGFADPDKFHEWIHEQTGMPYEDYRQQVTDTYLTQRLIGQEIQSHISVPEPAMRKYYEDHKSDFVRKDEVFVSQIILSTEGKTPEQVAAAEKKAKDLVDRARKGDKFSELARANSDDPETARDGGQLPPQTRGIMRPEIEAKVFAANKGTVLDPITIPGGIVILRVDDRYEAGQESFDEAKDQIQSRLAAPIMMPKVREYLTKLRQQAFLEIKDGYTDTGAAPGKDTRWHEVVGLKPETTTKEEVAAHRRRPKFLGIIPHGTVAPGTKETSGREAPPPPLASASNEPATTGAPVATAGDGAGTTAAPAAAGRAPAAAPVVSSSATAAPAVGLSAKGKPLKAEKARPEKAAKPAKPAQPIKQ